MTKSELLALLAPLPDNALVVLDAEHGLALAQMVSLVSVRKTAHDWRHTPVGGYRLAGEDGETLVGPAIPAVLISLEGETP